MSPQTVQVAKKSRSSPRRRRWPKKGPRLWVEVTKEEAEKARRVARHEGLARGFMLRRFSLNQLLAMYDQLFGAAKG